MSASSNSTLLFALAALFILSLYSANALSAIDFQRIKDRNKDSFNHLSFNPLKPIGYVGGEPIWPRSYEYNTGDDQIFFDDSGVAFNIPSPKFARKFALNGLYGNYHRQ